MTPPIATTSTPSAARSRPRRSASGSPRPCPSRARRGRPSLRAIPPVQDPQRSEGVPTTRRADLALDVEVDATGVDPVEQPPAVGLALRPHELDALGHARIGVGARVAEVVEGAQHVVVPVVGEREVEVLGLHHVARALAPEEAPLEQVLLAAAPNVADRSGPTGRALELDQAVEHVDRRVERRPHRSVLRLAVPAAVAEPLTDDAFDDRSDVLAQVGTGLDGAAVDAGLDLTLEVGLAVVLPPPVLGDERGGPASGLRRRVETEDLQRLEDVHRRRPGLTGILPAVAGGEAGAARPQPVRVLGREQLRTPALVLHAGSLLGDLLR